MTKVTCSQKKMDTKSRDHPLHVATTVRDAKESVGEGAIPKIFPSKYCLRVFRLHYPQ